MSNETTNMAWFREVVAAAEALLIAGEWLWDTPEAHATVRAVSQEDGVDRVDRLRQALKSTP